MGEKQHEVGAERWWRLVGAGALVLVVGGVVQVLVFFALLGDVDRRDGTIDDDGAASALWSLLS